jgi:outer membrane protein
MTALLVLLLAQAAPERVLTLEEAQRVAQERQPQLRAARASAEAAQGRVEQSRAPLLPQLAATGGYERTTTNYVFRPGSIVATGPFSSSWNSINYFDSSVAVSQLLWDFGQTVDRWRSTRASARASADQERAVAQQLLLQVRTAFFNALASKELLSVARETLANQRNHLVQIEGFVHAGTRPPIDLSQARADLANSEVQVINSVNAYERSKVQLNQVMGVEGPIDYDMAHDTLPFQVDEDAALEPLLARALAARPEIAFAIAQVEAQQLLLGSARGGYGPAISASAGLVQGTASGTGYTGWNASAGVSFSWNLFQGGFTNGVVHEAEANLAYAAAQLDVQRQQVRVDVEQALLAIRAAKGAWSSSKDALLAARERLSLAEGRYQNGSGSVIELGDAQIAAANAAAQVVQTELQLATARAQLVWAIGRAP